MQLRPTVLLLADVKRERTTTLQANKLRVYEGAVAIITGAASGIGLALAEALAQRGAQVILADLQGDVAKERAEQIRANGGQVSAADLDVTDFGAVEDLVQQTVRTAGRIDYLFNNAGIAVVGEVANYQLEDWHRVLDVNLRGVVHGVQAVYPVMCAQGFGHIINTASIAGLFPFAGLLSYSASKHAVVGLSTCLRLEAAYFGVQVSVLCPGAVDTPIATGGRFGKVLSPLPPAMQRQLWEKTNPIPPETFARSALSAIARNKAIIIIPWKWKLFWWLYRLSPSLTLALGWRRYRKNKRMMAGLLAGFEKDPSTGQVS